MSIKSVNRRWLAFPCFNVVSFDYNLSIVKVNRLGPPTRLPQFCASDSLAGLVTLKALNIVAQGKRT